MTGPFVLAIELDGEGAHPSAWRASSSAPDQLLTGSTVAARAAAAERAGFTIATFQDAPLPPAGYPNITARIDAVQRAAYAAPLTSGIGLVPVVAAVYSEPFHVSTQLASVDLAASGRAGWIVDADPDARIAAAYGRPAVPAETARERTADAVDVSRRLWDSWEDDAVITDAATGRYLDRDKLHYARFEGSAYSIVGPAIVPRPPQGQLPVFGAADLFPQVELDVALLDVALPDVVADPDDQDALIAATAEAAVAARAGGVPRVLLELEVILDHAGLDAAARLAALDRHTVWAPSGRARFSGTTESLTGLLLRLSEHVDGVRLHPAVLEIDGDELGRAVLPSLRALGVFASPAPGATLRHSLGLARPANRFASAAAAASATTTAATTVKEQA